MKRLVLAFLAVTAALYAGSPGGMALADEPQAVSGAGRVNSAVPPGPPPGWEAPPPLTGVSSAKKAARARPAACCAYDRLCCTRQSILNEERPRRVAQVFEARWSEVPQMTIKTAPKEGPGIPGVPPARVVDGGGRPFPWPDGPKDLVRVMPPGQFGEIVRAGDWPTPFFADQEYRGMGYGVIHTALDAAAGDKGKSLLVGPIAYLSFAQGEGDRIVVDRVTGSLAGSPEISATEWGHVEAAPVALGVVHAYREKVGDEERVVYLLPEVILGFESLDTKVRGGFLPVRMESTEAYTMYSMPAGSGRSGMSSFRMDSDQARRWFRPKGAKRPSGETRIALSASQTAAEPEPRLRVLIFEGAVANNRAEQGER